MNETLKQLFEEDQHDLRTMRFDRVDRDRERRKKVKQVLDNGGATVGIDFIHAAIIYQHGEAQEDWWQAYQLSVRAVELGFKPKWLAALALDRWLLSQGLPLKYGTQVIPFGGVYRIPKIDPNTTDDERIKWDVPLLSELYSFRNLRGFMNYEIVGASKNENLKVNVIRLERPPAHTPALSVIPCGITDDNRSIFENPFGWQWVENSEGTFDLGWLLMPNVSELAHAVVDEGTPIIEKVTLKDQVCILINYNESKTLYTRSNNGVWAITGFDYHNVIEKALSLLGRSSSICRDNR
ncbi:hypothetical protein [Sutcliffiella halmapala]|uniref:hypothetical protein n=1 Tax=Sutcliffiella halmapala TaxID=79882 RepID=UPI000995596D|nr:hypothetical protein [Sutcliffiella halmapala]